MKNLNGKSRPWAFKPALGVMFAVNNPDNGMFQGTCEKVDVPEFDLEIVCTGWRPFRFRHNPDGTAQIGHLTFQYFGFSGWVGNWCWDQYTVSLFDLCRILNYLRKIG